MRNAVETSVSSEKVRDPIPAGVNRSRHQNEGQGEVWSSGRSLCLPCRGCAPVLIHASAGLQHIAFLLCAFVELAGCPLSHIVERFSLHGLLRCYSHDMCPPAVQFRQTLSLPAFSASSLRERCCASDKDEYVCIPGGSICRGGALRTKKDVYACSTYMRIWTGHARINMCNCAEASIP